MKKIELFQCEICGTRFKAKEACQKCENTHNRLDGLRIVEARFLPNTQDKSGMPITIMLANKNGDMYRYKR